MPLGSALPLDDDDPFEETRDSRHFIQPSPPRRPRKDPVTSFKVAFIRGMAVGTLGVLTLILPLMLRPGPGDAISSELRPLAVASHVERMTPQRTAQVQALEGANTLNIHEATRVGPAIDSLSNSDAATFDSLLGKAGSATERAFLYKALAAGHRVNDIATFANEIRGHDPATIVAMLTPADVTVPKGTINDQAVQQQWWWSCGATDEQILRMRDDPIFTLRARLPDWTKPEWNLAFLKADQMNIRNREIWHGDTFPYPFSVGFATETTEYNALRPVTGVDYNMYAIAPWNTSDTAWAIQETNAALDQGIAVPMIVGDSQPGHAIVAIAHSGSEILIADPNDGTVGWVDDQQFFQHTLDHFAGGIGDGAGGQHTLMFVALPNDRPYPGHIPVDNPTVAALSAMAIGGLIGGGVGLIGQVARRSWRRLAGKPRNNPNITL